MDTRRETWLAAAFGLGGAVVAVAALRVSTPWIPTPAGPRLPAALPVALAATSALLVLCWAAFRRFVARPSSGGWRYALAFACANFAVDWLFLLSAFRGAGCIPGASAEQLQAVASFMPLVYLAMLVVPVGCERLLDARSHSATIPFASTTNLKEGV